MKRVFALSLGLFFWIGSPPGPMAQAPLNNVILGSSGGAEALNILRRIIERDKIWQKYGLNVRNVFFNSGTVLIQAVAGGNVAGSESRSARYRESPSRRGRRLEGCHCHHQPHRACIRRAQKYRQARRPLGQTVGRFPGSDRLPIRSREWFCARGRSIPIGKLSYCNQATRQPVFSRWRPGHVDGALVSPESVHKIVASGCSRILADLADLPMDYARYGYAFQASYIKTQRETLRRLLMAYPGSHLCVQNPAKGSLFTLEEEDIKDPVVQKDVYERALKSVREFPLPEPNGIQSVLDSLPHPNARNVKPASVMDPSILEEIKKSGFIDKLYGRAG